MLERAEQMLAFEPGDWGPLFGGAAARQTLGGMLACNLAGPRRIKQGAARDHLLGFHAVSGRGEAFKAGGRVVKNVTGYDLSKLMAGSHGTLAVLTEVTVKVLPRPEATGTLVWSGLDDQRAVAAMTQALNSPHEVGGAAHLPDAVAAGVLPGVSGAATLIRVEGPRPSVEARAAALGQELAEFGRAEVLLEAAATAPWRALADVRPFAAEQNRTIWRISVAPQGGSTVAAAISRALDARIFFDWGGGLLWCAISGNPADAGADIVRAATKTAGGHATLIRASDELRARLPVFEPQPPALEALSRRIKESFDPKRILNPGRMYRDF
jgi:glycolate oxidase FAD binding subunit